MNARDLQACLSSLTPFSEEPPEYTWDHHRWAIRRHAMVDKLGDFLHWSTITATMFVGHAPYIPREYNALIEAPDAERWQRAMRDPGFGNPEIIHNCGETSGNYIHQAYHLFRWEQATGHRAQNLRKIVEFGGGYGSLCVITRALGFTGEYVIYDVPEFSYLQSYYLSNLMVDFTPQMILPFKHQDNQKDYRYLWEYEDSGEGNDLLVGCYSLSEVRKDLREKFIDTVNPQHILIAHQDMYNDEDISVYFARFADERPQYEWWEMPTGSLEGHWYVVGRKI